jgi:hypothetical protein
VNLTTNREYVGSYKNGVYIVPCPSTLYNENMVTIANRSGMYKSVLCRVATWYTVEDRANPCLSVVHRNKTVAFRNKSVL